MTSCAKKGVRVYPLERAEITQRIHKLVPGVGVEPRAAFEDT
jgi:hypothetical protein